jgi:hypothetical protein
MAKLHGCVEPPDAIDCVGDAEATRSSVSTSGSYRQLRRWVKRSMKRFAAIALRHPLKAAQSHEEGAPQPGTACGQPIESPNSTSEPSVLHRYADTLKSHYYTTRARPVPPHCGPCPERTPSRLADPIDVIARNAATKQSQLPAWEIASLRLQWHTGPCYRATLRLPWARAHGTRQGCGRHSVAGSGRRVGRASPLALGCRAGTRAWSRRGGATAGKDHGSRPHAERGMTDLAALPDRADYGIVAPECLRTSRRSETTTSSPHSPGAGES